MKGAPAQDAISRGRMLHVSPAIGDGPQDDSHAIRAAAGSPKTRSRSGQAERQNRSVGSSPGAQCPVVWHTLTPPSWVCCATHAQVPALRGDIQIAASRRILPNLRYATYFA
jgi:hypothetical protein